MLDVFDSAGSNHLRCAMSSTDLGLQTLDIYINQLSGTIPATMASLLIFRAHNNELSGTIPHRLILPIVVSISDNRLTGSLPTLENVLSLGASHNSFEGTIPSIVNSNLLLLFLSGAVGHSGGLNGQLPSGLRQASGLMILTAANHQMEGVIPSFTSTLSQLALHKNRFKVCPDDIHLKDSASTTVILLHDNLLSCHIPWCGNASAKTSVVAIGNRFGSSKGELPAWVSKYEHDPLFWVSDVEGTSLLRKIAGGVAFLMSVMASRLDIAQCLTVMSRWQIGPPTHSRIVRASSHLVSCLVRESLLAVVSLMVLLFWDLYACPQTLAIASACLRSSGLIRALVLLCWCRLSFHSQAVEHFVMEGQDQQKQWTRWMLRKRLLLWLLWCVLTLVLSAIAVLYQVSQSIPGFLPAGNIWSLGLKACVGIIQGVVGNFILPFLAGKFTWNTHLFTAVSNFIMNCLLPGVVIVHLDTGCLGRWVALWKPCRTNRQSFQHRLLCNTWNSRDCQGHSSRGLEPGLQLDVMAVRSSEICNPHFSWSSTSMSRYTKG